MIQSSDIYVLAIFFISVVYILIDQRECIRDKRWVEKEHKRLKGACTLSINSLSIDSFFEELICHVKQLCRGSKFVCVVLM